MPVAATRFCDPFRVGKSFVRFPGVSVARLPQPPANFCDPFRIGCVCEALLLRSLRGLLFNSFSYQDYSSAGVSMPGGGGLTESSGMRGGSSSISSSNACSTTTSSTTTSSTTTSSTTTSSTTSNCAWPGSPVGVPRKLARRLCFQSLGLLPGQFPLLRCLRGLGGEFHQVVPDGCQRDVGLVPPRGAGRGGGCWLGGLHFVEPCGRFQRGRPPAGPSFPALLLGPGSPVVPTLSR